MAEIFDVKQARHVVQFGDLMHTTKMLARAVDEVERLRAENKSLFDKKIMANVDLSGKQESLDMLGQSFRDLNESNVKQRATIDEQAKRIQALESDLKYAQEGCQHGRQEHARLAAILGESDALHVLAQQAMDRNAKLEAALIDTKADLLRYIWRSKEEKPSCGDFDYEPKDEDDLDRHLENRYDKNRLAREVAKRRLKEAGLL